LESWCLKWRLLASQRAPSRWESQGPNEWKASLYPPCRIFKELAYWKLWADFSHS
jgi:hypothetical protein